MTQTSEPIPGQLETATLGGGCFWCLEPLFQDLIGVHSVESGYSGGRIQNPGYREVCSGTTGHAEVVRIVFDSSKISFQEILEVFFTFHDPTTLNRQGADAGTQYRSVVFYHNEKQRDETFDFIRNTAQSMWSAPIVTEVSPLINYYKAEDYHQNYYSGNPNQPYCAFVIGPKVKKFREKFKDKLAPKTA